MPSDTPVVERDQLTADVMRIIADVLVVSPEEVKPDSALVADLGAESIDFLDIIFNLEETLGRSIPQSHWQQYVEQRFGGGDLSTAITTTVIREFAEQEAGAPCT
jgi:acyl carrier protein